MRNYYRYGTVLVSVRIWESVLAIQEAQDKPLGTLVNDCLDHLVHALQMGDVFSSQGEKLIRQKGFREQYTEGPSKYTKIRIRRQNVEYLRQNTLNVSQCVNYAVKWFGPR